MARAGRKRGYACSVCGTNGCDARRHPATPERWEIVAAPVLSRILEAPSTMGELLTWASAVGMAPATLENAVSWLHLRGYIARVPGSNPTRYHASGVSDFVDERPDVWQRLQPTWMGTCNVKKRGNHE